MSRAAQRSLERFICTLFLHSTFSLLGSKQTFSLKGQKCAVVVVWSSGQHVKKESILDITTQTKDSCDGKIIRHVQSTENTPVDFPLTDFDFVRCFQIKYIVLDLIVALF